MHEEREPSADQSQKNEFPNAEELNRDWSEQELKGRGDKFAIGVVLHQMYLANNKSLPDMMQVRIRLSGMLQNPEYDPAELSRLTLEALIWHQQFETPQT